jgi:hypothetical protein
MRATGLWSFLWPGLVFAAAPTLHLLALSTLKSLDGTQGTTPVVGYQVVVKSELEWTSEMHVCMWYSVRKSLSSDKPHIEHASAVCSEQPSGTFPFDSPCGDYAIRVAIVRKGSPAINEQSLMSAIANLELAIDCTSENLASTKAYELQQRVGANISTFELDELWQAFHADIWQLLVSPEVDASRIRTVRRIQRYLESCNSLICSEHLQQLQRHARWSQVCHALQCMMYVRAVAAHCI